MYFVQIETEAVLVKLHEDMKELDKAFKEEQEKVNEVKGQIDEFKERMNAQNQEIAKRIAGKEKREAQVNDFVLNFEMSCK